MAQSPLPGGQAPGNGDPSMDEILASIRRILNDEEKVAKPKPPQDGVLHLDASMLDDGAEASADGPDHRETHAPSTRVFDHMMEDGPAHGAAAEPQAAPPPGTEPATAAPPAATAPGLLAPAAAAQAATSVGALMRTLAAERNATVYRGGPTIEDLVRDEIRPLLKAWLDQHLPGTVERLVRAEIERVVGRVTG